MNDYSRMTRLFKYSETLVIVPSWRREIDIHNGDYYNHNVDFIRMNYQLITCQHDQIQQFFIMLPSPSLPNPLLPRTALQALTITTRTIHGLNEDKKLVLLGH